MPAAAPSPPPAGVRPIVLALAPPSPGASRPPALTVLGGSRLIERLLTAFEAVGLPTALVAAAGAAAPGLRDALGERAEVLAADGDRRDVLAAALTAVDEPLVLIHDAERPLVPASVFRSVLEGLDHGADAVVPVIAMTDSVKEIRPEGLRNVERSTLAGVQSPRLLRRETLEAAVGPEAPRAEDEVLAALATGATIRTVHGSHAGFAVTDRLSLWRAQITLGLARDTTSRHGVTLRG